MRPYAIWVFVSLSAAVAGPVAAAEPDRGAAVAAACAACHRLDGLDKGIPSIVGLDAEKLAGKIRAFKSNEGSSQIMHVMSLSLSDDEIAAVAHYLAARRKDTKSP